MKSNVREFIFRQRASYDRPDDSQAKRTRRRAPNGLDLFLNNLQVRFYSQTLDLSNFSGATETILEASKSHGQRINISVDGKKKDIYAYAQCECVQ